MPKSCILRLVPPRRSTATIQWLEQSLTAARANELIGIASVLVYSAGEYRVDVVGEARRRPTLTRGMLPMLDEELRKIILLSDY
jgi:hypothetical protein